MTNFYWASGGSWRTVPNGGEGKFGGLPLRQSFRVSHSPMVSSLHKSLITTESQDATS